MVHFFNLANDAYMIVKGLRGIGVEADVVVMKYGASTQYPHWEEVDSKIPFKANMTDEGFSYLMSQWTPPPWVKFLDIGSRRGLIREISARVKMMRLMREYDLVVAHVPSSIYAMIVGVPYIPFDAGFIRYIIGPGVKQRLALRSYRTAPFIIYTNPDTVKIFESFSLNQKLVFCPFAIDTEKYSPGDEGPNDVPMAIFCPSRHIWREKGNDIAIRAFDAYRKLNPQAELHLCRWGEDLPRSMSLLNELGTTNVIWHEAMSKPKLISLYRRSDVVLDQFVLGSYGTSAPEAMSCGKPVIMHLVEDLNARAFGEMPPVINVRTQEAITSTLASLDRHKMLELGRRGREWVLKKHSLEAVAKIHLNLYSKIGIS